MTVPGVRYVVDAGTARISRYSHRLKVQRLPIEEVSQASADQRAGRCGRVAPGICIRLYAEDDFAARPEFTEPEILRTNLASVILQMANLGLGDVAAFPFLDPPDARAVRDGVALLEELGALDPDVEPGGPWAAHPRSGASWSACRSTPASGAWCSRPHRQGCVREVLVIAAALSIQDVRERPLDQQQARRRGPSSLRRTRLRPALARRALGPPRRAAHGRCPPTSSGASARPSSSTSSGSGSGATSTASSSARRRLGRHRRGRRGGHARRRCTGRCWPACCRRSACATRRHREFRGARGRGSRSPPARRWPSKPPAWVMAAELVETNRLWARGVAAIRPEWVEDLAGPLAEALLRRTSAGTNAPGGRSAPRGSPCTACPIVARPHHRPRPGRPRAGPRAVRRPRPGPARVVDTPRLPRRQRGVPRRGPGRRRQGCAGPTCSTTTTRCPAFYDARIGADVVSGRHFDRWWKEARRDRPRPPDPRRGTTSPASTA